MGAPPRSIVANQPPERRYFPPPSPPIPRRRRPQRSAEKDIVLVADDAKDGRDLYAGFFELRGFRAVTAGDGEEAVALAVSVRPRVIDIDLTMPRLDGIAATRRLKQDPRTRRIPVILLTGHALRAIDRGALEAGVDVFLRKPCLPDELEDHVRRSVTAGRSLSQSCETAGRRVLRQLLTSSPRSRTVTDRTVSHITRTADQQGPPEPRA